VSSKHSSSCSHHIAAEHPHALLYTYTATACTVPHDPDSPRRSIASWTGPLLPLALYCRTTKLKSVLLTRPWQKKTTQPVLRDLHCSTPTNLPTRQTLLTPFLPSQHNTALLCFQTKNNDHATCVHYCRFQPVMKHHNTTGSATLKRRLCSKLSVTAFTTICLCSKCAAVLQQPSPWHQATPKLPLSMHNSRPETSKCTHAYPYTEQTSAGHCHLMRVGAAPLCRHHCCSKPAAALQFCFPASCGHAISSYIHTRYASHALLLYIQRTPGSWHSIQTQLLHMQ
jgi:hypothetical protein